MYGVSTQAYDRAITVFSPDGRLFQVEYAKEAVKRGATSIGFTAKDGVVFVAFKSIHSKLVVPDSLKKIFTIDKHVGVTASGLIADARRLVEVARVDAQRYGIMYDEKPDVDTVARSVGDLMQIYTQYGGIRPFGVSLLIGGVDKKPKLFEAEPSGAMTAYKADAIGANKKEADELLEKRYDEKMKMEEAIQLGLDILKETREEKLIPDNIEIATVPVKTKEFMPLGEKEIARKLKGKD